jgi:twitching motility protein PilT
VVFTTLHTVNAGQTINRILGMFSREEEQQVRQRLAATLRYVVSQRLLNKIGGGRLLVTEIMGSSLRTRETIAYGESENKTFHEIIEAASSLGWKTFDHSILEAYKAGIISDETAIVSCTNKGKVQRELDLIQKQRGQALEQASGLKMHIPEPIRIVEAPAPPAPSKR